MIYIMLSFKTIRTNKKSRTVSTSECLPMLFKIKGSKINVHVLIDITQAFK